MNQSNPSRNLSKTERRRQKRTEQTRSRRRRVLVIASAVVAVLTVVAAAVLVPAAVRRNRVVVSVEIDAQDEALTGTVPYPIASQVIESALRDAGRVRVGDRSIAIRLEDQADDSDARVVVATPLTPIDGLVAVDPYILAVDEDSGVVVDSRASLSSMLGRLAVADDAERVPLVVAGDVPAHFASFIVYLSAELLPPSGLADFLAYLEPSRSGTPTPEPGPDQIAEWIERLEPVTAWIAARRDAGLLATNWTDWDELALRNAITSGAGSIYFTPRSYLKGLDQEARFSLTVARPPAGEGRLTYRLVGHGVAILAGPGPVPDSAVPMSAIARAATVQERLERETGWTPVALTGDAVNIEHRDVVRWISNAEAIYSVDPSTVAHPLMRELHRLLR